MMQLININADIWLAIYVGLVRSRNRIKNIFFNTLKYLFYMEINNRLFNLKIVNSDEMLRKMAQTYCFCKQV
jgi:hypothetical protein